MCRVIFSSKPEMPLVSQNLRFQEPIHPDHDDDANRNRSHCKVDVTIFLDGHALRRLDRGKQIEAIKAYCNNEERDQRTNKL